MFVTTAEQSTQRDAAAIAAGTEGFALMLQAGTHAAAAIMRLAGTRVAYGVDVFVGSGNNGGDGYIVAAQLARLGVKVRVVAVKAPATPDAIRAASLARSLIPGTAQLETLLQANDALRDRTTHPPSARGVIVDALLGTGAHGALRDHTRDACQYIRVAQQHGTMVLSLDMPTGVNATTGEPVPGHVIADATIMFGSAKIGALSARLACGHIVVVDIGLGVHAALQDDAAQLASATTLRAELPPIAWNAHKGTRGRTLIVGGTVGMSGAVQLACSGALASGAGLVRASVARESVASMQASSAAVVSKAWPESALAASGGSELGFDDALDEALQGSDTRGYGNHEHLGEPGSLQHDIRHWAHVVAIGPGLGRDRRAAALLQHVLECVQHSDVALILDADALTVMAQYGMLPTLRQVASARPVVITPHLGEFRTIAQSLSLVPANGSAQDAVRITRDMASALQCTVLCKGTPSICASANGDAWIIPRGSSALATGGTGDVLTGILAALLASARADNVDRTGRDNGDHGAAGHNINRNSTHNTPALTALGAWVHGVAGETLAPRGSTVLDVVHALPTAWDIFENGESLPPGVLADLPAVHEHAVR